MKLVREHINEKFQEESDPIVDMNIGVINQIRKDLKDEGISEDNVRIENGEIYTTSSWKPPGFIKIQLKYLPKNKKDFAIKVYNLSTSRHYTSAELEIAIENAYRSGISFDDIQKLIKEYANDEIVKKSIIPIAKLKRSKKDIKHDKENNIYVFIGYEEKVPVIINGKKYYEDKFMAEKLMKIDRYNVSDLHMVDAMKMRAQFGKHGHVYMINVPKEYMDEDSYEGIPEENRYIIEKYKKRI